VTARRRLDTLTCDHVRPVVEAVLRRRGAHAGALPTEEAEDLAAEAMVAVVRRLTALRPDSGEVEASAAEPPRDLRAYAAMVAYHTHDAHLHARYPARWRLQKQLRYLCERQDGLALWRDGGAPVVGFSAWRTDTGKARPSKPLHLPDPRTLFPTPADDPQRIAPAEVVARILRHAGTPIPLDDLVGAVAVLWDVKDAQTQTGAGRGRDGGGDEEEDAGTLALDRLVDKRADVAVAVEQKETLQRFWQEISDLPQRQCAALLLNLRDGDGRGVIDLLPVTGVASIRDIAKAVGMEAADFAALWNDLPLDDNRIAELLGATRQQIINLRKVARERLGRRLRGAEVA
jgi:hypothetical protein